MNICSKCQSDKIIPNVGIRDGGGLAVAVKVRPPGCARVFKGEHASSAARANCGDCGNVEAYVDNPQELYAVYLASQQPKE